MSFNCQTPSCAIAISKAEFPMAMNCPVCQTPLSEVVDSLSQEDMNLIDSLPYVIAYPLQQTLLEKHPPQRINLFKDTFLNYLKYLGLLSASEFFNSDIKDKGMVLLFQQNLIETAFGKWNHYIRESLKFLKEQNHILFCPELATYYELVETGNKSKKHKGEIEFIDANGDIQLKKQEATSIGMLINFRNRYLGHGLTLDAQKAEALWQEYFPIFRNLLEQLSFAKDYPMLKQEDGITYLLHSSEIKTIDSNSATQSSIWIQNKEGKVMDILPFFIVPGEVSLVKEDKEQMLTYESYTGKTIKFFSPEGTEKQTSGKLLEKLNLLLRDKQKEVPFTPQQFTKEEFLNRITDENKLLLETLVNEKKIIPGVYQHREEMEIKLREWIGARANIFFIAAEAGSGKTNLLVEIQKQYAERDLPSLLIRAGRMEKQSLKAQIAYLFNIDLQQGLENYFSIAGTQAKPTFILIDGLNEANHAEAIWKEILSLSTIFEAGCLKFVITNRANTKGDLERYLVSDNEQELLYGENKENENGLGAYSYWLTSLDMKEMKGAWENYVAKDKARFKPQFTFDAIAEFDRAIYNQINNPLILRLFLEIYNGKPLPKKENKHLHIWSDWFKTFSRAEQTFFTLLADAVWQKGENELLLDDVLNNEILKLYFTSDVINSPYQRLKNLGWISSYTKDLNSYVGFTVEGSLLYLLGVQLQKQTPKIDLEYIQRILQTNNKLQTAAIEAFLCEEALMGNLDLVSELIDTEDYDISICITPLVLFLKTFGVKATIDKILENPTERDWDVLLKLYDLLDDLQLLKIQQEFSIVLFDHTEELFLNLPNKILIKILPNFNYPLNNKLISIIEKKINSKNEKNEEIFLIKEELAFYFTMNGFAEKAILIYNEIYKYKKKEEPKFLNTLGCAYMNSNNKEEAFKYYYLAKEILHKTKSNDVKLLAMIYFNLAPFQKELQDKVQYYENGLELEIRIYGLQHSTVARTLGAIGLCYIKMNLFDIAYKKLNEAFEILNSVGAELDEIHNYFGYYYSETKNYKKALEHYEKVLEMKISKGGDKAESTIIPLRNVADIYESLGDDNKSLDFFLKAKKNLSNNNNPEEHFYVESSIGYLKFYLSNYDESILHFIDAINIYSNHSSINYLSKNINTIYYYLGYSYYYKSEYLSAEKILINLSKLTINDVPIDDFIDNNKLIGNCFFYLEKYTEAIESYNKIIYYQKDGFSILETLQLIASCFEYLNENNKALDYYIKSAEIHKNYKNIDLNHKATQEAISNAIRLGKELNKESELPEWMK